MRRKFPRDTPRVPSEAVSVEQVSEGWPALVGGAPKMNQAGPSTLVARSAWSTLQCPRLSKLVERPPKWTVTSDRGRRRAEQRGSLSRFTRRRADNLRSLPAPTRRAGALRGLRPDPVSGRLDRRGAGEPAHRLEGSLALRPQATVSLTAEGNPRRSAATGFCTATTVTFAAPPPGRPERRPDGRCTPTTPRGCYYASDGTPTPRRASNRSRHTNRRPVSQRPPAAPLVTDSPL